MSPLPNSVRATTSCAPMTRSSLPVGVSSVGGGAHATATSSGDIGGAWASADPAAATIVAAASKTRTDRMLASRRFGERVGLQLGDALLRELEILALLELLDQLLEVGERLGFLLGAGQRLGEVIEDRVAT